MNRLTASLLVLFGAACYGMLGPFVKQAYDAGFTPQDVTSSQFGFAWLMMVVLAAFKIKGFRHLTGGDIRRLTVLGVLATGTSIFYYESLSYLPASLAIVFLFQFAWMVMLFDFFMTRKKPSAAKWASIILVLLGTVFAVDLFSTDWSQVSKIGLLFGFLSSITYSAFLYWNEKVESKAPAIINSFILTTAAMITIFFVFPPRFLWNQTLGNGLWVWALIIGGLGQVIPPIMFNRGIPIVGGSLAGILASIELPVAVIAAALLLGEYVTPMRWLGVALILIGILVAEVREPKEQLLQGHT